MPHGAPDWGVIAPKKTVYILQDMAELAARLGSIVTFDRRGDVVWLDDFESGAGHWYAYSGGTDGSTAITTEYSRSKASSFRLNTGSGDEANAVATAYLPMAVLSKLGMEVSFTVDSQLGTFDIYFNVATLTAFYLPHLCYDATNDRLRIYADGVGWIDLKTSLVLSTAPRLFHTLKVVIDPLTGKWVRVILDGESYDVSAYSMYSIAGQSAQRIEPEVQVYPTSTIATVVEIDDVIITQNEP